MPTARAALSYLREEAFNELLNPRQLLLESNSVEQKRIALGVGHEVFLNRGFRVEFVGWLRLVATVRNVLVVACSLRAIATC